MPDSRRSAGNGHLSRCGALADALERIGWETHFVLNPHAKDPRPDKINAKSGVIRLAENAGRIEAATTLQKKLSDGCTLFVIDHYECDRDYETAFRGWAEQLLTIEDLPGRNHDCDILLDQTFGRTPEEYNGRLPESAVAICGSAYALLRKSFWEHRRPSVAHHIDPNIRPSRLFVSVGAQDTDNAISTILDGLEIADLKLNVDIAIANDAPHLDKIEIKSVQHAQNITLHIGKTDLSQLMSRADFAIGAAGVTSWERCCLGLPTILVSLYPNQQDVAANLERAGAVYRIERDEFTSTSIAEALHHMVHDHAARIDIAQNAGKITDGLGSNRIASALAAPKTKNGERVRLRPAIIEDTETILSWQTAPEMRQFFHEPRIPTVKEHAQWMEQKLNDADCVINIILKNEQPAGMLRLEAIHGGDLAEPDYEISILIAPEMQDAGIGKSALAAAKMLLPEAKFVAQVMPKNIASCKLFESAGYVKNSSGQYISKQLSL